MNEILCSSPIASNEINEPIVPAKNCVGLVIAAGLKGRPNSSFVHERTVGLVTVEDLNAIATHRKKPVPINEQALRTAPAQACRYDLERIKDSILVFVYQSPNSVPVADEQASLSVEAESIAPARYFRGCRSVNMKSASNFELIIQQRGPRQQDSAGKQKVSQNKPTLHRATQSKGAVCD
jgi:hypothetical protein